MGHTNFSQDAKISFVTSSMGHTNSIERCIGLGQDSIGLVCGDAEDINSISLTVVQSLLEKYCIDPKDAGRRVERLGRKP